MDAVMRPCHPVGARATPLTCGPGSRIQSRLWRVGFLRPWLEPTHRVRRFGYQPNS